MRRITFATISLTIVTGCATDQTFREQLAIADRETEQYIRSFSTNSVYPMQIDTTSLSEVSQQCPSGASLKLDPDTNLFIIKNGKDRICVKRWVDSYFRQLNRVYDFRSVGSSFMLPSITDLSNLESISFEDIETNLRLKFISLYRIRARRDRQAVINAQRVNEQASSEALLRGSRQISEALTTTYTTPAQTYSPAKQLDYTCITRCQQAGYVYALCTKKCEY